MIKDEHIDDVDDEPNALAKESFPKKLYALMEASDPEVVRWEEHGRAFRIANPERFATEVLPNYFRHSKLTSFQRQLNLYGFRRVTKGEDQGAYYHQRFQRGRADSVAEIRRLRGRHTTNGSDVVAPKAPGASDKTNMIKFKFPVSPALPAEYMNDLPMLDRGYSIVSVSDLGDFKLPQQLPVMPSPAPAAAAETPAVAVAKADFDNAVCEVNWDQNLDMDLFDSTVLDALFDDSAAELF